MKRIKNNKCLVKLSKSNLNRVSGGFLKQLEDDGVSAICDNCGSKGGIPMYNGRSHLCFSCIEKLKSTLGDDLMKSYLNGQSEGINL